MLRRRFLALCGAAALSGCAYRDGPPLDVVQEPQGPYTLAAGDRLRIIVFGQDNLSNSYAVDGGGRISMPLIGIVHAGGQTTAQLERTIEARLRNGFLREPKVSVEVEQYRPFFILGEVKTPGQYAFVDGMTAVTAVAMAGGFTYRARQDFVLVTRGSDPQKVERRAPVSTPVLPDDVLRVPERFF